MSGTGRRDGPGRVRVSVDRVGDSSWCAGPRRPTAKTTPKRARPEHHVFVRRRLRQVPPVGALLALGVRQPLALIGDALALVRRPHPSRVPPSGPPDKRPTVRSLAASIEPFVSVLAARTAGGARGRVADGADQTPSWRSQVGVMLRRQGVPHDKRTALIRLYGGGGRVSGLAERFGCNATTVSKVLN
jgi:hypothetical protein